MCFVLPKSTQKWHNAPVSPTWLSSEARFFSDSSIWPCSTWTTGWRHVCSVGAEVSTLSPNPPNQKGCEIVTLATAVLDHGGRGSLQPWKAIHHQTHNTSHVMCHRGPWPARNRSLSRVSISPNLGCQEMAFLEHPTTRNRSAVSPNLKDSLPL